MSDKLKQYKIWKTGPFIVTLLINYLLNSEAIFLAVCTEVKAETICTECAVTAMIKIDLNKPDKYK